MSFVYKKMNKKIRKEAKRQGEKIESDQKNYIDKNKEKIGYFIWNWCILHSAEYILGLSCMY